MGVAMKTINLIYYNNGVGLKKDAEILKQYIKNAEIFTTPIEVKALPSKKFDYNIFLQDFDELFFPFAEKNILIPNPEWTYDFYLPKLSVFDLILTKSEFAKNLFEPYNSKIVNIGFASVDRYNPLYEKRNLYFHLSGKSIQKNTELVIECFREVNEPITIIDDTDRLTISEKPNINYINHYLNDVEIDYYMNRSLYHICPSLDEGWGHYIYEGLSTKSIIIANNCPPYNEFLTKETSILLNYHTDSNKNEFSSDLMLKKFPLRRCCFMDKDALLKCINELTTQSHKYIEITKNNCRELFLAINSGFEKKINSIF
jgi:hypothetical protein